MTRALPQPSQAARRGKTSGLSARITRTALAMFVSGALMLGCMPGASADDESDKAAVDAAIVASQQNIDTLRQQIAQTQSAKNAAYDALSSAQTGLAQAKADRESAQAADIAAQAALVKTQQDLVQAKADVVKGQAEVDTQVKRNGGIARAVYSGQTSPLVSVAVISQATSVKDLQDRMKWQTEVMQVQGAKLEDLQAAQQALQAAQKRQEQLEAQASAAKAATQSSLEAKQNAESKAAQMEAQLASAAQAAEAADNQANQAIAAAQSLLASQQAESAELGNQIRARIAAQEAERARQAAEAAAAAAAAQAAGRPAPAPAPEPAPVISSGASNYGFVWPSNGALTSGFGWRVDPVTGSFTALHDGQDIAPGCGAPIYATGDGVVSQSYYSTGGGGNFLTIDHGRINGSYITSAYAHAQGYIVSPGQHVSAGQVIGYVGTTGWSTGCHLHFMIYVNGTPTDPLPFLP